MFMGELSLSPSLVTPVNSSFGVSLLLPLKVKGVVSVPLAALNRITICLFKQSDQASLADVQIQCICNILNTKMPSCSSQGLVFLYFCLQG